MHGELVLRIEDLDTPRVKPWAHQQAIEDLRWLGLDWEEGPDLGGPYEPYTQTLRRGHYEAALERLREQDLIYPCTCSRTDVAQAASAPHVGQEGPIYPGTCSAWKSGDALPTPGTFCWRFRVPDVTLTIEDALMGTLHCNLQQEVGDFPITRKEGDAAYQLAVVVDDAAMRINHVVRGNDLVLSAFRQRVLQNALGLEGVGYAHVPLVIGEDGRRLAKRHGDTRLSMYREAGVKAEKVVGLLAWSLGFIAEPAMMTARELIPDYAIEKIPKAPFVLTSEHEHWLRHCSENPTMSERER